MNSYLDVGVSQIQSWLARTPRLRGRRGASTMIRKATSGDTVRSLVNSLGGLAEINSEQGPIDGVISLRLHSTGTEERKRVEAAVLAHLRSSLPAAMLEVARFEGPDYHSAKTDATRTQWPARVHEYPLARPCDWCHSSPGSEDSVAQDGEHETLCIDCSLRSREAGRATDPGKMPGPERDLLDRLHTNRTVPDKFPDLAEIGLGGSGDRTHVATVFADGNQLGRFIATLREERPEELATIPKAISEATWSAVVAGLTAIDHEDGPLPVIAHLVGGDDILLTVPAHGAWKFVTEMTSAFHDALEGLGEETRSPSPTLSAGAVIHHHSYPLAATIDLATELLRQAKGEHVGRAAMRWHSITHDGPRTTGRPAVLIEALRDNEANLKQLAAVPASQRQQLAWFTRTDDPGLDKHVKRLGLTEFVAPFTKPGSAISLRDALDMVRWWSACSN